MIQAWLTKPKSFEVRQVERPKIKGNELLVRVMYCGICGSDLHGYSGKNPFTPFPCLMGHEFVGRVEETGGDVRNIGPGQVVTAEPINNCGKCVYCRSGLYNHCLDKTPRVGDSGSLRSCGRTRPLSFPRTRTPGRPPCPSPSPSPFIP